MSIMKLGIPYMGSKRQIADKIVDFVLRENPNCKYVWDLFGGGGALSFEFLQREQIKKVYYNDLNTGVVELLRKIKKDGVTKDFYQWIDRDTFMKHKDDNSWFGGLCKTIWSFGNSQNSYLFGRDSEEYKKNYHLVVVEGIDKTKEMMSYAEKYVLEKYGINEKCELVMPIKKNIQDRRLEIRSQLNIFEKKCKLNQEKSRSGLKDLRQLRQLQQLQQLEQLQQLQHLERLQQLRRLQQLEHLERLEIFNLSYKDVLITSPIEETIIILDPPYRNTAKYQCGIDYDELYEYVRNSPYKVYMCEYDAPFKQVFKIKHRSTLSATNNNKRTNEYLFCNK